MGSIVFNVFFRMFFQIVECCHYLSQQSTGDKDSDLVTLITGTKNLTGNQQTGFSPLGVAKSAGVPLLFI
jgi:hypothetical protein